MVFQENLKPCLEDDIAITHLTYGKDLKWDGLIWVFVGYQISCSFGGWKVLGMDASMMGSLLMNHFAWGMAAKHSLATLKTVFLLKISEPRSCEMAKALGMQWSLSIGWRLGIVPINCDLFFPFMDSTLTMFRQYPNHQCEIQLSVSMFPHFVLNLL